MLAKQYKFWLGVHMENLFCNYDKKRSLQVLNYSTKYTRMYMYEII